MQKLLKNKVLVIVPPNSNTVFDDRLLTVTRPEEHSDWSDYLSLGPLSLVSSLRSVQGVEPIYIDGTIIDLKKILNYITIHCDNILAVCVGVLTANYEAGVYILNHAKSIDSTIWSIIGNDHFTALPMLCMESEKCIDFGFVGNEVVGPFTSLIRDLFLDIPITPGSYPSLVMRLTNSIDIAPSRPEAVFSEFDYSLIDGAFDHTSIYSAGFQQRVAPRIKELLGRSVSAGIPVDIGRGCVKFANNNACSFCSIQYGGMWRNNLSAIDAWNSVRSAFERGYDYLYLTADELPLTFGPLLKEMNDNKPDWWASLSPDDRPILVGYARADGVSDLKRAKLLKELGIHQVMIGLDAGEPLSLAAMNKPLTNNMASAGRLFKQNTDAIQVSREAGILIRAGFVIGHIGMSYDLLKSNIMAMKKLIFEGRDVISALDIEVLSPQPGSFDFTYLVDPTEAQKTACHLGLSIANDNLLEEIAIKWKEQSIISPELAMRDYATALMPDLEFSQLAEGRSEIRSYAKKLGIVIGE